MSNTIRVYRYLKSEYALLALQTKEWKIGRLNQLNDPFDCSPLIDGPSNRPGENYGNEFLKEAGEAMGLICYSRAINDPVIWSHYADSHFGIALGFDYIDGVDGLFEVRYPEDNKRAVLTYNDITTAKQLGGDKLTEMIAKGFTVKASSWAYEQEFRHFIFFHGCEMRGPHYFRIMPCRKLKEIVLGANCVIGKSDIQHILDKNRSGDEFYENDVKILKAGLDKESYKIIT